MSEKQEPIARVAGTYGGRFVIEALNPALVLPVGMALYSRPRPEQDPNDLTIAYMSGFHDGKKMRKPLTDEQIEKIAKESDTWLLFRSLSIFDFARAIEAAHGIKETR